MHYFPQYHSWSAQVVSHEIKCLLFKDLLQIFLPYRHEKEVMRRGEEMKKALQMHPADNVATVLANLSKGEIVQVVSAAQESLQILEASKDIPFGHKIALSQIEQGGKIIKYGEVIGIASKLIQAGDHVHIHNVESARIQMPKAVRERRE